MKQSLKRNFIKKIFNEQNFAKLLNGYEDIDDFFDGLVKKITNLNYISGAEYQYNGIIDIGLFYTVEYMPEFVEDEKWKKLKNDYQRDYDAESKVLTLDDDTFWVESEYNTCWRTTRETLYTTIYLFLGNTGWFIKTSKIVQDLLGHSIIKTNTLKEAISEIEGLAIGTIESDAYFDYKPEDWKNVLEKKAEELNLIAKYNPEDDNQLESNFEDLIRKIN